MIYIPMDIITALGLAVLIGLGWNIGANFVHGRLLGRHAHSVMVEPTDLYDKNVSEARKRHS